MSRSAPRGRDWPDWSRRDDREPHRPGLALVRSGRRDIRVVRAIVYATVPGIEPRPGIYRPNERGELRPGSQLRQDPAGGGRGVTFHSSEPLARQTGRAASKLLAIHLHLPGAADGQKIGLAWHRASGSPTEE